VFCSALRRSPGLAIGGGLRRKCGARHRKRDDGKTCDYPTTETHARTAMVELLDAPPTPATLYRNRDPLHELIDGFFPIRSTATDLPRSMPEAELGLPGLLDRHFLRPRTHQRGGARVAGVAFERIALEERPSAADAGSPLG